MRALRRPVPDPLFGWRLVPSVLTFGAYILWRDWRNRQIKRAYWQQEYGYPLSAHRVS